MATTDINSTENEVQAPVAPVSSSSSKTIIIVLIIVLLIILSLPIIFIRTNALGLGEVVRPYLKTSMFRGILPASKDLNDTQSLNRDQLIRVISDSKAQLDVLQKQFNDLKQLSEMYTGTPDGLEKLYQDQIQLKTQKDQLQVEKDQLNVDKNTFYQKVISKDVANFKEYYEKVNPEIAKQMYGDALKEFLSQQKVTDDMKNFVVYYEKMDAASVAKIFEQLAKSKIILVANILQNMDQTKASKILQLMDYNTSSKITDILAKQTSIQK